MYPKAFNLEIERFKFSRVTFNSSATCSCLKSHSLFLLRKYNQTLTSKEDNLLSVAISNNNLLSMSIVKNLHVALSFVVCIFVDTHFMYIYIITYILIYITIIRVLHLIKYIYLIIVLAL